MDDSLATTTISPARTSRYGEPTAVKATSQAGRPASQSPVSKQSKAKRGKAKQSKQKNVGKWQPSGSGNPASKPIPYPASRIPHPASICLSIHPSIHPSIHLPYPPTHPSIHPHTVSTHLAIRKKQERSQ
jgi:hypothetical protein